jgi:hypothetical protein
MKEEEIDMEKLKMSSTRMCLYPNEVFVTNEDGMHVKLYELVLVKGGEKGYHHTKYKYFATRRDAQEAADELNIDMGVTRRMADEMVRKSMGL